MARRAPGGCLLVSLGMEIVDGMTCEARCGGNVFWLGIVDHMCRRPLYLNYKVMYL